MVGCSPSTNYIHQLFQCDLRHTCTCIAHHIFLVIIIHYTLNYSSHILIIVVMCETYSSAIGSINLYNSENVKNSTHTKFCLIDKLIYIVPCAGWEREKAEEREKRTTNRAGERREEREREKERTRARARVCLMVTICQSWICYET